PGSYLSNPDISRAGDNAFPGFVDEDIMSYNYEIGAKWSLFDNRLTTTAALFRTEKHLPVNTAINVKAGDGEQIVQGLELSVAGQITEAWSIFGGLALMDSERRHDAA